MTRTKQTKRPRQEAETFAEFQQEYLAAPSHASSHLWLQFHDESHKRRLLWVMSRHMITPGVIHHPSLDKYGIGDEVRGMLTPRPLTRLLNLNKPSYWELTYEFLSTFVLHHENLPYHKRGAITFHLGGIKRSVSIQEWALMTGLYEPEDTHDPDFDTAIHKWPQGIQQEAFWASIGNGDYHPSTQLDIQIREPVIRLLHQYIARSMSPRTNSPKVVTPRDLFFLHCLVTNTPCHVAICLANFFHKYSRTKGRPGALFGGGIITQVAEKLGVCLEGLSEEKKVVEWDEAWMLRNEILERVEEGDGLRLKFGGDPPIRPAKRVAGRSSIAATEAAGRSSTAAIEAAGRSSIAAIEAAGRSSTAAIGAAGRSSTAAPESAVDARIPSDRLGYEILQESKATQATVTALQATVIALQATVRELQSTVEVMARVMGLRPAVLSQSAPMIPTTEPLTPTQPFPAITPTADVDPLRYARTSGPST